MTAHTVLGCDGGGDLNVSQGLALQVKFHQPSKVTICSCEVLQCPSISDWTLLHERMATAYVLRRVGGNSEIDKRKAERSGPGVWLPALTYDIMKSIDYLVYRLRSSWTFDLFRDCPVLLYNSIAAVARKANYLLVHYTRRQLQIGIL
jgi:hypothetical protein